MGFNYSAITAALTQGSKQVASQVLKAAGYAGKAALNCAGKAISAGADALGEKIKNTDKKTLAIVSGAAAATAAIPVWMCAPGRINKTQKAPFMGKNFAHRGLHSEDKRIPENSLKAFDLAASAGYGIELDVQLSKDGQVVVFHDDDLRRVCGVDARVDERTYAQLHAMKLCGTKETIPLLVDVLAVINGRGPLIVELKNGKNNKELCEKTCEILRCYEGDFCIESFNPAIVAWFRLHAKDIVRGQLATTKESYGETVSKPAAYLLSRTMLNFLGRPQFIAYRLGTFPLGPWLSCKLGAMRVCWTSHDSKNEKGKDAVIFEFYRPRQSFK